jgi:hypothetical protein
MMFAWIGLWSAHTQLFLLVLIALTSVLFALPIFLVPLRWASCLRWRLPKEADGADLAVYFGRCLGAFILIIEALMLQAALTGEGLIMAFHVLLAVAVLMVIVHIQGAIQRIQPLSETLEIGMYSGIGVLALLFYPVAA